MSLMLNFISCLTRVQASVMKWRRELLIFNIISLFSVPILLFAYPDSASDTLSETEMTHFKLYKVKNN